LLQNALACFLAQDYPKDRRELVILDDSGLVYPQKGESWELISVMRRFSSLSEKHNAVASLAFNVKENKPPDIYCVWDDDDVYLPWHISTHVKALAGRVGASKPSMILSTYGKKIHREISSGRFQGSLAFWRDTFKFVSGWPITKRADFDQEFINRLSKSGTGFVDPCEYTDPSYVYRWETTETSHCSAFMKSGGDESWYDRYAKEATFQTGDYKLSPKFDDETRTIYDNGGKC